jgi:hypothetical protein
VNYVNSFSYVGEIACSRLIRTSLLLSSDISVHCLSYPANSFSLLYGFVGYERFDTQTGVSAADLI